MKKKKDEITIRSSAAEYLTYVASVGDQQDSIEMRYEDENIWLTQKMMATLYDVDVRTINYHVKKIFSDSELQEDSVIRKFRITAADGKSYSTNHYSLEMIIAVGFKVNSERAVQFRKWVNQIAKDYTIKGWVMDDERLKNGGSVLTTEYFDRLLEQIREIRLSERRFYQKITDIYATALDYDRTSKTTKQFFAKVQNKMHYAVHGHTAAELIYERADADKPHMGLTTWAAAPEGKIVKSDVSVMLYAYLRGEEERREYLSGNIDINYFDYDDTHAKYSVGEIGNGMKYTIERASVVREIQAVEGSKLIFKKVLPLMGVEFVRYGMLTVVPFPFKYLREYIVKEEKSV